MAAVFPLPLGSALETGGAVGLVTTLPALSAGGRVGAAGALAARVRLGMGRLREGRGRTVGLPGTVGSGVPALSRLSPYAS